MRREFTEKIWIMIVLMFAAVSIFCGCSGPAEEVPLPDEEAVEVMEEYVSEIERHDTPDGVFAAENRYVMLKGDFAANIIYPVTGNEDMDREILSYVQHAVSRFSREAGENPAELSMEYKAYIVDKQFMGVKMTGTFDGPFMAHPE
ncbi:MAG: hypothetical protein II354_00540, partial [Firmicutes bacterium]|nr:hypothetical protein [Bacillota bacterium]